MLCLLSHLLKSGLLLVVISRRWMGFDSFIGKSFPFLSFLPSPSHGWRHASIGAVVVGWLTPLPFPELVFLSLSSLFLLTSWITPRIHWCCGYGMANAVAIS